MSEEYIYQVFIAGEEEEEEEEEEAVTRETFDKWVTAAPGERESESSPPRTLRINQAEREDERRNETWRRQEDEEKYISHRWAKNSPTDNT